MLPELEVKKTPQVHLTRGRDVEFVTYIATFTKSGEELASMTGIHAGGLTPAPDWVKGLSSFTVRGIDCGDVQWIDLRGASEGGLRSRWVGYAFSSAQYSRVAEEAAQAFDRAIDNGCCREPISTKPDYPLRLR